MEPNILWELYLSASSSPSIDITAESANAIAGELEEFYEKFAKCWHNINWRKSFEFGIQFYGKKRYLKNSPIITSNISKKNALFTPSLSNTSLFHRGETHILWWYLSFIPPYSLKSITWGDFPLISPSPQRCCAAISSRFWRYLAAPACRYLKIFDCYFSNDSFRSLYIILCSYIDIKSHYWPSSPCVSS